MSRTGIGNTCQLNLGPDEYFHSAFSIGNRLCRAVGNDIILVDDASGIT
jgi:hypothetical protein